MSKVSTSDKPLKNKNGITKNGGGKKITAKVTNSKVKIEKSEDVSGDKKRKLMSKGSFFHIIVLLIYIPFISK
jgi:hypothetical protein